MLESGLKISNLPTIPINSKNSNFKNKIGLENTFFLSYAHSTYGINYNKQNYKVPLNALREDFRGYIGLESLVAPWSEQLKLWHGYWNNVDKNKSYVYVWDIPERNHEHYAPQKFCDLENSYYIIKDAPFPFETEDMNNRDTGECPSSELSDGIAYINNSINVPLRAADPYIGSNKLVTKSYIDERLGSKRLIEVYPEFRIRDYDCTYIIRAANFTDTVNKIKIQLPENYDKRSLHNKIEFTLLIEGKYDEVKKCYIPPTKNEIEWEIVTHDNVSIIPTWLNSTANEQVDIRDEYLYSNARYLIFRFETVTGDIQTTPITTRIDGEDIITKYDITVNYNINILCENLLYRSKGIEKVNDKKATHLKIVSDDNTVIPDTSLITNQEDSIITVNLSTDIRSDDESIEITKPTSSNKYWNLKYQPPFTEISGDDYISTILTDKNYNISFNDNSLQKISYIERLPESINDLKSAHNKVFWTTKTEPEIIWEDNSWLSIEPLKSITFHLFYKPSETCKFKNTKNIRWVMSHLSESPEFVNGKTYYITFTLVPRVEGIFEQETCFARINWFIEN